MDTVSQDCLIRKSFTNSALKLCTGHCRHWAKLQVSMLPWNHGQTICVRHDDPSVLLFYLTVVCSSSIRGCGHLFCYKCLRFLAIAHLRGLIDNIPSAPSYLKLPRHGNGLALEDVRPSHLAEFRAFLHKRQFKYLCPVCRHMIEHPPVKIPLLSNVLSNLLGAVEGLPDVVAWGEVNSSDGTFEDLFHYWFPTRYYLCSYSRSISLHIALRGPHMLNELALYFEKLCLRVIIMRTQIVLFFLVTQVCFSFAFPFIVLLLYLIDLELRD